MKSQTNLHNSSVSGFQLFVGMDVCLCENLESRSENTDEKAQTVPIKVSVTMMANASTRQQARRYDCCRYAM